MFVTKPRLWLVCALEKISVIAFDALNVATDPSIDKRFAHVNVVMVNFEFCIAHW